MSLDIARSGRCGAISSEGPAGCQDLARLHGHVKAEKARRGDPVPSPKSAGPSGVVTGLAEVADEYDAFDRRVFNVRSECGEKFGWELIEWPCARFRAVGRKSARVERRDEDLMDGRWVL